MTARIITSLCRYTGLKQPDIEAAKTALADKLYHQIPVGVGSTGRIHLDSAGMKAMLSGGARWAIERGYGEPEDLERIEEHGCMDDALPEAVSGKAKQRQRDEMGTLGLGNHYLEVQEVVEIFDAVVAAADCAGLSRRVARLKPIVCSRVRVKNYA